MGLSAHSLNTKNSGRLDDTRCFFMGLLNFSKLKEVKKLKELRS